MIVQAGRCYMGSNVGVRQKMLNQGYVMKLQETMKALTGSLNQVKKAGLLKAVAEVILNHRDRHSCLDVYPA